MMKSRVVGKGVDTIWSRAEKVVDKKKKCWSVGDNTQPWGTPALMWKVPERTHPTRAEIEQPDKMFFVHDIRVGLNPKERSLARRPACHTQSKALAMSRAMTLLSPD